jgi:hypothetical protein
MMLNGPSVRSRENERDGKGATIVGFYKQSIIFLIDEFMAGEVRLVPFRTGQRKRQRPHRVR